MIDGMEHKIILKGRGALFNCGSLKTERAAKALQKRIVAGKVDTDDYSNERADVFGNEGGPSPEQTELVVKNSRGAEVFRMKVADLPYGCFKHAFWHDDPLKHRFVWQSPETIEGTFRSLKVTFCLAKQFWRVPVKITPKVIAEEIRAHLKVRVLHTMHGDGLFAEEMNSYVEDVFWEDEDGIVESKTPGEDEECRFDYTWEDQCVQVFGLNL